MKDSEFRLIVQSAGFDASEVDGIADDEQVLVGRNPDWSTLPEAPALSRVVTVPSPSVSSNHVRIERRGKVAHVTDLGSLNGTWLRIPAHAEVLVPAHSPLVLQLASATRTNSPSDAPIDPTWTSTADFGAAVRSAVARWLERTELSVRVEVGSGSEHVHHRVPLANGRVLTLTSTQTVGPTWFDAVERIERFVARLNVLFATEESMRAEGLIVASPAMRATVARVVDAAMAGARAVLLTGPSGSGKEGLARCFHRRCERPGPFVARNCAMFSKDLLRSELFGAEKGAFTGSVQRIVGAVETANEGTLFLDELGELARDVQPMLLRFLDHGEYERLGSYGQPRIADVRVVAATNRDLRAAAQQDAFRADLWYRLSVHVIDVPPLRDRFEDIMAYLATRGARFVDVIDDDVREVLAAHDWSGNFRELVNFAERMSPLLDRGHVDASVVRQCLREGSLTPTRLPTPPPPSSGDIASDSFVAARRARDAYLADHEGRAPATWDEIKDLVENYLKPVLFADLADVSTSRGLDDVDLREASERLRADRGTALKQLRRFFDRFTEAT